MKHFILAFILIFSSVLNAAPPGNVILLSPAQSLDYTGAVFYVATSACPSGSIPADGTAISRSGIYAGLFQKLGTTHGTGDGSTTFNVPDLRGIFVRGSGSQTISSITYSGTLGTKQGDQMQGHSHQTTFPLRSAGTTNQSSVPPTTGSQIDSYTLQTNAGLFSDGTNGTPRAGTETRPANISLTACISYVTTQVPTFFGPNYQTTAVKTSAYSITTSDEIVQADTTSGAFAVTLPSASSAGIGKKIKIVKVNSGANLLSVTGTIQGATKTTVLHRQGENIEFWSDGTSWQWGSDTNRTEAVWTTCSASSTVWRQTGNWVTIGNIASGSCTLTVPANMFSQPPHCVGTLNGANSGITYSVQVSVTNATSLVLTNVYNINATTSSDTAGQSNIICTGPR